jgi:hypothetical protein
MGQFCGPSGRYSVGYMHRVTEVLTDPKRLVSIAAEGARLTTGAQTLTAGEFRRNPPLRRCDGEEAPFAGRRQYRSVPMEGRVMVKTLQR